MLNKVDDLGDLECSRIDNAEKNKVLTNVRLAAAIFVLISTGLRQAKMSSVS